MSCALLPVQLWLSPGQLPLVVAFAIGMFEKVIVFIYLCHYYSSSLSSLSSFYVFVRPFYLFLCLILGLPI